MSPPTGNSSTTSPAPLLPVRKTNRSFPRIILPPQVIIILNSQLSILNSKLSILNSIHPLSTTNTRAVTL